MKLKTLIVCITTLATLSAVTFWLNRPKQPPATDARIGQPVVAPTVAEKSKRLRLSDQGKTVTLSRQDDGSWIVEEYHGLPADFSKLSQLVGSLTEAHITRFVSARPEVTARLELKDTHLDLTDATGKNLTLVLGKNAETGGRYLRYDEEPRAYLADLQLWLDLDGKNWADSRLLDLTPEQIAAIELPAEASIPARLIRTKTGDAWSCDTLPSGKTLETGKIEHLLASLTQPRFTETVATDDPSVNRAAPHSRRYELTTFDGRRFTLTFARQPEEKRLKPPTPPSPETLAAQSPLNPDGSVKTPEPAKAATPEFETIPAGPVFLHINASDEKASVNRLMSRRAYQVGEYVFTSLPETFSALLAPTPPAAAPTTPAAP